MILHKSDRRRSFLWAILGGYLIAISPVLDGCTHGDSEPSPQASAPATPADATPAFTPATATPAPSPAAMMPGPPPGAATAQELQELVSPIALYPDLLVAQIRAASTYPTQVVEAHRWLQQNSNLTGDALAAQVNPQPWDPSVKSLTQFAPVLQTMDANLAWSTALGEAYYNQPAGVMNAIQVLRERAIGAGTLKNTPQQKVVVESAAAESSGAGSQQTIIIKPAEPTIIYVPQYNPQAVYGAPVAAAPGYAAPTPAPGYSGAEMLTVGLLSFGLGMLVANAINDDDNHWGCNWHGGSVSYNNNVYVSRTNNIVRPGYGAGLNPRPPYAGSYPRPNPLPATRPPYNGNRPGAFPAPLPATRPYNPAKAKEYATNNPNITRPNFPKPETLPNNPERGNLKGSAAQKQTVKRPASGQAPANRAGAKNPAESQPAHNSGDDSLRGYAKDRSSTGGRKNAFGGYQPGGLVQETSGRGRASLSGGGNRPANGNRGGRANKSNGGNRDGGGGRKRD